jgi:DHA1 family bicyclomycin/chloramphenicol resistance-like MFS transporter
MAGVGMLLPQTMAGALASFPGMAGSASALFGFIQMVVAAIVGVLVGYFHNGTPVVMASIIGICAVSALASYLLLIRNHAAAEFQTA